MADELKLPKRCEGSNLPMRCSEYALPINCDEVVIDSCGLEGTYSVSESSACNDDKDTVFENDLGQKTFAGLKWGIYLETDGTFGDQPSNQDITDGNKGGYHGFLYKKKLTDKWGKFINMNEYVQTAYCNSIKIFRGDIKYFPSFTDGDYYIKYLSKLTENSTHVYAGGGTKKVQCWMIDSIGEGVFKPIIGKPIVGPNYKCDEDEGALINDQRIPLIQTLTDLEEFEVKLEGTAAGVAWKIIAATGNGYGGGGDNIDENQNRSIGDIERCKSVDVTGTYTLKIPAAYRNKRVLCFLHARGGDPVGDNFVITSIKRTK